AVLPRDLTEPSRFPNHFFCDSWVVGFLEGPTMISRTSDWRDELGRWLKPFVDRLGHKARRQMCPLYVSGLSVLATARAFSRWRSGLRSAHAINCITSLRPGSGTQRLWKPNYLSKQTGSSAAAMPCW